VASLRITPATLSLDTGTTTSFGELTYWNPSAVLSDSEELDMPETKDTMEEELKTMTRTDRIYKAPIRMRPSKADMEPFDGKEVTEFLDEYNRQANNSLLTES
jgi:hypothetical protein